METKIETPWKHKEFHVGKHWIDLSRIYKNQCTGIWLFERDEFLSQNLDVGVGYDFLGRRQCQSMNITDQVLSIYKSGWVRKQFGQILKFLKF
jgi:hypothetical protein